MNIIFFLGDLQGCGFYRCGIPAKYLLRSGVNTTLFTQFSDDILNWADLCVLQRQYSSAFLEHIIRFKKLSKKFVYDLDDDLFNIPYWNPAKRLISEKDISKALEYLKVVDILTTSTPFLKKRLTQYTDKPIFLLPNSLDFEFINQSPYTSLQIPTKDFMPQILERKTILKEKEAGFINIFWGGGFSHYNDLKIVLEPLIQICKEYENVIFYMMAFCLEDFWKKLPSKNIRLIPAQHLFRYLRVIKTLCIDIGLAPLAKNIFNESKSNLKVIEYLALGISPLASDYAPYRQTLNEFDSDLLVKSEEDWYQKIVFLIKSKEKRDRILLSGPKFASQRFDIAKNIYLWRDLYHHVIKN